MLINWFLGSAWEPISRGYASNSERKIGGIASGSALPGRAWEPVKRVEFTRYLGKKDSIRDATVKHERYSKHHASTLVIAVSWQSLLQYE